MAKTIREQFVEACREAIGMPFESPAVQRSQIALAERMAKQWMESNSMEFKLFKLGHAAGREETTPQPFTKEMLEAHTKNRRGH